MFLSLMIIHVCPLFRPQFKQRAPFLMAMKFFREIDRKNNYTGG